MKITVVLLLLVSVSNAANTSSKSREKIEEKPDKRGLVEGNVELKKRTPVLPTVSPGIEYADTKQNQPDKSPSQQIYATPVPQVSKISDFVTGQGPPFQAAIASHLYSPISVYNPSFEAPTTYEVSPPVPSQLAYTEHRLSMPSLNSLQYTPKPQKLEKSINYPQPQVLTQQSYEQQNLGYEPLLHQIPSNALNNFQTIQYNPAPHGYIEQQQLRYIQDHSNQLIPTNIQQHPIQNKKQHLEQRELKSQPAPVQVSEKQNIQQVYNDKQQNALSFARFTLNPTSESPATPHGQIKNHQLHIQQPQLQPQFHIQPQHQAQPQYQTQQIIQSQPQQYQAHSQPFAQIQHQLQHPTQLSQVPYHAPQELKYQISQQIQYQQQPQIPYQEVQPQFYQQYQPQFLHQKSLPQPTVQSHQIQEQNYHLQQTQPQYFEKSGPIAKQAVVSENQYFNQSQMQPQLSQQIFPQQQIQNLAYKQPAAIPAFPPVQYFGKFAQSIFANSQH